ncbi:glycosyltransferase family 32 protein [Leucogyrophana mollusca]|uniref:Glycosyltransferase family 32 protein n=1 Tax=Leucogyrophana mollusca TaxID=85980 RepID=A0ACB8BIQ3_9AGAM|nr:glycosyltransferase family 32 protein [Leucogyrophana mollusca]
MSRSGYERLPMSWGSSAGTSPSSWCSMRPRTFFGLLKIIVPLVIAAICLVFIFFEPHLELVFYSREWIRSEIEPILPLMGCFNPDRVSSTYNVSKYVYGPKTNELQAGVPMRMGLDCYDFAATIKAPSRQSGAPHVPSEERVQYHTYWRVDLAPFGERQEWMLKSFFATQNVDNSRLILWSNGDLGGNEILQKYRRRFPNSFDLRVVDIPSLARGTPMEGSKYLQSNDKKAWIDGDLIRLLVIWTYGGVWIDMDSLLTRDLAPLLEHEFVTQWDCYDKLYQALNGALMHFRQRSPYLCEAFHIMATSKAPRADSTDWGSILYMKLWRSLIAAHIPPFKILPFCFSDGRACRLDNRLPDPFQPDKSSGKWTMGIGMEENGGLDQTLGKVFSLHLHNQWEKEFPKGGWVERLLLKKYDSKLRGRSEDEL